MVTFVKATYVLAIFVRIRIISAVTDLILTKLCGPNFGGLHFLDQTFLDPNIFWTEFCFLPFNLIFFLMRLFLDLQKSLDSNFWKQNVFDPTFYVQNFLG